MSRGIAQGAALVRGEKYITQTAAASRGKVSRDGAAGEGLGRLRGWVVQTFSAGGARRARIFSRFEKRRIISSCMWSVFWCSSATSSSALIFTSYSTSERTLSFCAWRFWLMRTKQARKMASSETIMVSKLKGKGSKPYLPSASGLKKRGPSSGVLSGIQMRNQMVWTMRKGMLPENQASQSAILWSVVSCSSTSVLTLRETRVRKSSSALRDVNTEVEE